MTVTTFFFLCSLVAPRATPSTQSVSPLLGVTDRRRVLPLPRYDPHHSLTITRSLSLSHSVELPASRWSLLFPCSPFIAGHSSACGSIIRTIICRFSNNSLISSVAQKHLRETFPTVLFAQNAVVPPNAIIRYYNFMPVFP